VNYQHFSFGSLDAVELSTAIDLATKGTPSRNLAFSTAKTGTVTTATLRILGSIDGVNYFDISGNQAAASDLIFFVIDKPVRYLKAEITAWTGTGSVAVAGMALSV
jgi:hypothetical protein